MGSNSVSKEQIIAAAESAVLSLGYSSLKPEQRLSKSLCPRMICLLYNPWTMGKASAKLAFLECIILLLVSSSIIVIVTLH